MTLSESHTERNADGSDGHNAFPIVYLHNLDEDESGVLHFSAIRAVYLNWSNYSASPLLRTLRVLRCGDAE